MFVDVISYTWHVYNLSIDLYKNQRNLSNLRKVTVRNSLHAVIWFRALSSSLRVPGESSSVEQPNPVNLTSISFWFKKRCKFGVHGVVPGENGTFEMARVKWSRPEKPQRQWAPAQLEWGSAHGEHLRHEGESLCQVLSFWVTFSVSHNLTQRLNKQSLQSIQMNSKVWLWF